MQLSIILWIYTVLSRLVIFDISTWQCRADTHILNYTWDRVRLCEIPTGFHSHIPSQLSPWNKIGLIICILTLHRQGHKPVLAKWLFLGVCICECMCTKRCTHTVCVYVRFLYMHDLWSGSVSVRVHVIYLHVCLFAKCARICRLQSLTDGVYMCVCASVWVSVITKQP